MDEPRRVPVTQDIDGKACWPYYSAILYRKVPTIEAHDGDVVEVTYPRSGTHWVQQIIQLILSRGESVKTFKEFVERSPLLEMYEETTTESPRLLRTHFPMSKLRLSKSAKYVYVARNPWDCCVSCYHLTRGLPATGFADGTFDDFLDAFLDAKVGFGDYFEHVLSGYGHGKDPNVFFITYEELQRSKREVVLRLASFLGEHHRKVLEDNEDVLHRVLEKSTVAYMRKIISWNSEEVVEALMKNSPAIYKAQLDSKQTSCQTTCARNVRKGAVGDWRQHFTPENTEIMRAAIAERMMESDIMDLWKSD